MRDFEYLAPKTLDEALSILGQHGANARVLAGGTDLVLMLTDRVVAPEYVIDIKAIPELSQFDWSDDQGLTMGAATLFWTIETSPIVQERYPGLAEAAGEVGSWQIRNLGTVGGNLCTASPSNEISPMLYALDTEVTIAGRNGRRSLPIQQFITGVRRTALAPDELLVSIRVPPPADRSGSHYLKLKERQKMDIAFVGVGAVVELEPGDGVVTDVRIGLGAVAPTPIRAPDAEALLRGKSASEDLLEQVGAAAAQAAKPITDVRASAEYRREMVNVLTKRAIRRALEIANQR